MSERSHDGWAMVRLRAGRRVVAAVALFAMALQIFGTFGHIHAPNPSGLPVVAKSFVAHSETVASTLAADDATATADRGAPPRGDGDALCPLCLVGHLVASAIASTAPSCAAPVAYARLAPLQSVSALDPATAPTSFWSRGPPTS